MVFLRIKEKVCKYQLTQYQELPYCQARNFPTVQKYLYFTPLLLIFSYSYILNILACHVIIPYKGWPLKMCNTWYFLKQFIIIFTYFVFCVILFTWKRMLVNSTTSLGRNPKPGTAVSSTGPATDSANPDPSFAIFTFRVNNLFLCPESRFSLSLLAS